MNKGFKELISLLLILFTVPIICSCDKEPAVKTEQYYEFFNTVSTIQSYSDDSDEIFVRNCNAVRAVLSDYHRLFDIYYEYAGINNLATVNKKAGKEPVKVDERLVEFLLYCKDIYTLTGGETNVMLGAVLTLWHNEREKADKNPTAARVPTMDELEAASLHTSINSLIIDREASTVYISDPQASIDVGAIGKGYAAERAKEALIQLGVTSYVLNLGGNIVCIGTKPNGDSWHTVLKDPKKPGEYVLTVYIDNVACVTSGSYERYYTVDGVRYHHLIDKDTLMPAAYFASVTVFTNDSALADALSTALFCMSIDDGMQLINSIDDTDAVWIDENGKQYKTQGINRFLNH